MTHSQFHLRRATASDLDAVMALERATESAPHWPASVYSALFDPAVAQRCLYVAEKNGSLAGFAVGLVHPVPTDSANPDACQRVAELESVAVSADARRSGIARALCGAVLDWCLAHGATEVVLEVRAASAAAIALYTGLGFTLAARRPRYYRDPPDDAIFLRLRLE